MTHQVHVHVSLWFFLGSLWTGSWSPEYQWRIFRKFQNFICFNICLVLFFYYIHDKLLFFRKITCFIWYLLKNSFTRYVGYLFNSYNCYVLEPVLAVIRVIRVIRVYSYSYISCLYDHRFGLDNHQLCNPSSGSCIYVTLT